MAKAVKEKEENPVQGRKRGKKGERLRTVSKRPRTGNWRWVKIHSMPVLRVASVSGDTKTNVFMR